MTNAVTCCGFEPGAWDCCPAIAFETPTQHPTERVHPSTLQSKPEPPAHSHTKGILAPVPHRGPHSTHITTSKCLASLPAKLQRLSGEPWKSNPPLHRTSQAASSGRETSSPAETSSEKALCPGRNLEGAVESSSSSVSSRQSETVFKRLKLYSATHAHKKMCFYV